MDISLYQRQHNDILEILNTLKVTIDQDRIRDADVATLLPDLVSALKYHLTVEDQFVYPRAASSKNKNLKDTAHELRLKMEAISSAFLAYAEHWTTASIEARPSAFKQETNDMIAVIEKRIATEESQFYPLLGKFG